MNQPCALCKRIVYPVEKLKCLDQIWHKQCFKCTTCGMSLNMNNYKGYEKKPYCQAHYPQPKRFTVVADTPELQRVAANTRIFSNAAYQHQGDRKAYMEEQRRRQLETTPSTTSAPPPVDNVVVEEQSHRPLPVHAQPPPPLQHHQPPPAPPQQQQHQQQLKVMNGRGGVSAQQQHFVPPEEMQPPSPVPVSVQPIQGPAIAPPAGIQPPQPQSLQQPRRQSSNHHRSPSPPFANVQLQPQPPQQQQQSYVTTRKSTQLDYIDLGYGNESTNKDGYMNGKENGNGMSMGGTTGYDHHQQPPSMENNNIYENNNVRPMNYSNLDDKAISQLPKRTVYKALYEYDAKESDEVSFKEGDVIVEGDPIDDGWMFGRVARTSQFGMLPSNYVQCIH